MAQAGIDERKFARIYRDTRNREKPCYHLPKFEWDLLITGYSVPYRKVVLLCWYES
jgi:hypothetical protein